MSAPALTTAHLRLRTLERGDRALFRELYTDSETMRHIGRPVPPAEIGPCFRATLDATRKPRGPRFFAIVERRKRRGIGLCSIRNLSKRERNIELGIMLVPSACGHGYAREAFAALIPYAFRTLPIDSVWVQHSHANVDAARLNDSLGFSAAGTERPRRARTGNRVSVLWRLDESDPSHQPVGEVEMSNIIGFLENAGRDAAMRHANREQLLQMMEREEVAPAVRLAMLQTSRPALDSLLGVRDTMYCSNQKISPPKKKPVKKAPAKKPAKKAPAKKR